MIEIVTITGADNSIRPGALKKISAAFPFAEWGILVSRNSIGGNRFPDLEWLQELAIIKKDMPELRLSCHLCGSYVREILIGDASFINEIGAEVFAMFDRVQINTHGRPHDYHYDSMVDFMNSHSRKQFIFQFDNVNAEILSAALAGGVNASTLFDLSHGAGVLPEAWPDPIPRVPCGYAGGLSPENLSKQIELIEGKVGDRRIWIDVETKVRSENDEQFDLQKVVTFLQIAEEHMKAKPARGVVNLTQNEQDFATYVGYEVKLKDGGTGVNMGLHFPEVWAEDGILKANGVNVFFPEQNKIYVQNFNQVELIFPNGISRLNPSEALFGFMAWMTSRKKTLCVGHWSDAAPVPPLLMQFIKANNLPVPRENWTEYLIPVKEEAVEAVDEPYEDAPGISTKHTSRCLRKAADDEPIFVLRAKDPTAPKIVRLWASANKNRQPDEKIRGAYHLAFEMEGWQDSNNILDSAALPADQEGNKG